jgi:hypothetical protein
MREDRDLSAAELAAFGAELDALRQRTLHDLGEQDARYIRRIRAGGALLLLERPCAADGRLVPADLAAGHFPPWAGQDPGEHGAGP